MNQESPRSVTRGKTIYMIKAISSTHLLLTPNNRGVKGEKKVKFQIEKEKFNRTIYRFQ